MLPRSLHGVGVLTDRPHRLRPFLAEPLVVAAGDSAPRPPAVQVRGRHAASAVPDSVARAGRSAPRLARGRSYFAGSLISAPPHVVTSWSRSAVRRSPSRSAVLLHRVLDVRAAMPYLAEMPVDPPDHRRRPVPDLALDGVLRDGRAVVEGLEPRGAERIPQQSAADLCLVPATADGDAIEILPDVRQLLPPMFGSRKSGGRRLPCTSSSVRRLSQSRRMASARRHQRHRARRGRVLEPPGAVGADADHFPLEVDVAHQQAERFMSRAPV